MSTNLADPACGVRVYEDPSAFHLLEDGWRELFRRRGGWNVFLSWQWFHHWWGCLGAGNELCLLGLTRGDRLVGIAPMMVESDEGGKRRLALIGGDRTTDYGDLLAEPECLVPLCTALAEFIEAGFGRWESVEFRSVPAWSALLGEFADAARGRGMAVRTEVGETCPVATLAPTWEEYLAALSKKDRHELRRKIRRSQAGAEQDIRFITTPEEVASGLDGFFRLHRASSPDKAAFLGEDMMSFFRRVGLAFAQEGWLSLNVMSLDGADVAASVSFARGERVLLYNSGLDPVYRDRSVGIALHAAELRRAIDQGRRWYDFLRGDEPYKYHLGGQDTPVFTLRLAPEGAGEEGGDLS